MTVLTTFAWVLIGICIGVAGTLLTEILCMIYDDWDIIKRSCKKK